MPTIERRRWASPRSGSWSTPGPPSRPRFARSPWTSTGGAAARSSSSPDRATTAATGSWRRAAWPSPGPRSSSSSSTSESRPKGATSARNWDRIARDAGIRIVHTPVARDVAMLGQGIDKAAVVVDALLGTGVRGVLREPIRSTVELIRRASADGIPVVAVDTPDRGRPVERGAVRPCRPGRPDRHVPPPQDRAADQAWGGARGEGPGRPDRHPARRGPWLTSREVGPLQVVLVAAACVAVVAAAVVVTILLPDDLEAVVYRTPLAIGVLIGVTARRALANRPPAAFLSRGAPTPAGESRGCTGPVRPRRFRRVKRSGSVRSQNSSSTHSDSSHG